MELGIDMDKQIILICIGAFISIFTSVVNKIIDNCLKSKGTVTIYRKLVYQKNSDNNSSGIYNVNGEIIMYIPIWIEIQNTKNNPIIIRDFSIDLFKNGKRICKMKKINYQKCNNQDLDLMYYGDKGRYSFIISPESIRQFDLLFSLKKNEKSDNFDEIKISYYNQKNKMITSNLKSIASSWNLQKFGVDEDWVEVN